jgi:hypothetical protein
MTILKDMESLADQGGPFGKAIELFKTDTPSFPFQHHRNAIADGIGQTIRSANELLILFLKYQVTFTDWTDQDVEEFFVHEGPLKGGFRENKRHSVVQVP